MSTLKVDKITGVTGIGGDSAPISIEGDAFTLGSSVTIPAAGITGTLGSGVVFPVGHVFASGTKMLFQQTAAPTGWTKDTTHDDKALRLTSGTVGTGGSVAFETAFASQTVSVHTLTTSEIPAHTHDIEFNYDHDHSGPMSQPTISSTGSQTQDTTSTGSGDSHGHGSINLDVQYVDIILASKD